MATDIPDFNLLLEDLVNESVRRRIELKALFFMIEQHYFGELLKEFRGNKSKVSRTAGISRTSLLSKKSMQNG